MFSAFFKNTIAGSGMKSGGVTLLLLILFTVFLSHGPHEKLHPAALAAAITGCDGCHGKPPVDGTRSGATGQFLGSHDKHAGTGAAQYAMVCSRCHYTYAENSTNYKHSNGFINISGTDVKGNSYSLNINNKKQVSNSPAFGSCTNVYCHSKKVNNARVYVPKQWTTAMAADCTGCHGNDKAAALSMTANAHKAHVNNTNGRFAGLSIKCIECHAATVTGDNRTLQPGAYGAGVHANGTPTVAWGTVNAGSPAYTGASCGYPATYCHSSVAGTAAPNTDPGTWNSVADNAQTNSSCAYCHNGTVADAPLTQSTNKHSLHLNVIAGNIPNNEFSCSRCHAYTMRPNNSIFTGSSSQHLNRVPSVSFKTPFSNRTGTYVFATKVCSNTYCHGAGASGTWNTTTQARNCGSCHAGARNNPIRWSPPHNRHYSSVTLSTWADGWRGQNRSIPSTTQFSCGVCHNVKDSHVSGPPAAGFGDAQLVFNFYTAWGPRAVSRPSAATKSSVNLTANLRAFNYSPETTCAVYCHSNGRNNFIPRNVKWTVGTVGCGTGACHQIGGVQYNWSSAHNTHVDSYIRGGNTWIKCNSCHTGTVNTAGVIINRSRHTNGYANVSSALINVGGNTTFIYVPGPQTCTSNNYCHSNGRSTLAARRYTNVVWTDTGIISPCLRCHGGKSGGVMVGSASGFMLSSSHRKHLNGSALWDCSICHSKTATNATTLKTYSGVIYHVNQSRNVILNNTYGSYTSYKGATFKCGNTSCHGGITRNAWSTPNTGHTCSKCHGVNGTSIAVPNAGDSRKFFAPGWNTTGTDTDGNSASIIVGAHFVHLSSVYIKKIKCNECHLVPTVVTDAGHNDAKRLNSTTISFAQASSATLIGGATKTYLSTFTGYTAGTAIKAATCSSVYCHGNRLKNLDSAGTARKPSWNQDLTVTPSTAVSCGRCHGVPPNSRSDVHLGLTFPSGCSCHSATMDTATGFIKNKALHINGIVENSADCIGCHSAAKTGGVYNPRRIDSDFTLASRHVFSRTVTSFDCVVCHLEGDESLSDASKAVPVATTKAGKHNEGASTTDRLVNLRNLQTVTSDYPWSRYAAGATRYSYLKNMDDFCMSCHNGNGAYIISTGAATKSVAGGTAPTAAERINPWSETTTLNRASGPSNSRTRARVTNVFSQFSTAYKWPGGAGVMPTGFTGGNYAGNASHHAVRGPRYFGNNANWGATAWSTAALTSGQALATLREKAQLHCADCHTSDTNGHGSSTIFMLANGATKAGYTAGFSTTNAIDILCWGCHSGSVYSPSGSTTVGRWDHSQEGGRWSTGAATNLGSVCRLCHAGGNGGDPDGVTTSRYGGIHGVTGSTLLGSATRYRFMGGVLMNAVPTSGDAGYNTVSATTCYGNTVATWDACASHNGASKSSYTARAARPTTY